MRICVTMCECSDFGVFASSWRVSDKTATSCCQANPSVNTYTSAESEDRLMRTGKHTVRDLYCGVCRQVLGWKYVSCLGFLAVVQWRIRLLAIIL